MAVIDRAAAHQGWPLRGVPLYFYPSFWAHVTDRSSFRWPAGHMRLTKSGKARTKLCA